jgi:hypothetical protein
MIVNRNADRTIGTIGTIAIAIARLKDWHCDTPNPCSGLRLRSACRSVGVLRSRQIVTIAHQSAALRE